MNPEEPVRKRLSISGQSSLSDYGRNGVEVTWIFVSPHYLDGGMPGTSCQSLS